MTVELQDAKDDLKDTQYEKFISDTEDMLDDMMNDYQEFIDEKLNDTNNILDGIKTLIGGDDGIIATLKSLDPSLTNTTKDQIDSSTTNGGDGGQSAKWKCFHAIASVIHLLLELLKQEYSLKPYKLILVTQHFR